MAVVGGPERDVFIAWATARGIELRWPEGYVRDSNNFHRNPCIDFGRVVVREPFSVVRPRTTPQLVDTVTMLREGRIPFHVRGAGHSSGGQSLSDGGFVIHTQDLTGIVDDDPASEHITVLGGTWWLTVIEHLQRQGRRPIVLTGNPRVSVAGTLAVGGFGDTTHLEGLAIRSVVALTLITPDGARHVLRPGDELFAYVLGGQGQLGVIADATIRTMKRPLAAALRYVRWATLEDFVRDAGVIAKHRLFTFVRARISWEKPGWVDGAVGNFASELGASDHVALLRASHISPPTMRDLLADLRREPEGKEWQLPTPAMEVALPLPDGLRMWSRLRERIIASGLVPYLSRGTSVMVVPPEPDLPLAPLAPRALSLLVALRPEVPAAHLHEVLPTLRAFGDAALALGGRIHLISQDLECDRFPERQFGEPIARRFRALKAELDPDHRCNPGLLLR